MRVLRLQRRAHRRRPLAPRRVPAHRGRDGPASPRVRHGLLVPRVWNPQERADHPIAYRHALRSDGRLFLPTLHEHGPAAHAHGPMWDHVIFSLRQGHPQSQSQQAGYVSEDYDARPPWLEEETIEKSKEVGVSWQEVAKAVGPALAKHLTSGTNGATLKKINPCGEPSQPGHAHKKILK